MRINLDDIEAGGIDGGGRQILTVYNIVNGRYAVYGTRERVLVQYSPDPELRDLQQKLLVRLGPLRGQINGLVDDWRISSDRESTARARAFDARVAAALSVALEGDVASAEKLLAKIHFDILEERAAAASVSYVLWAAAATAAAALIACVFTSSQYRLVFDYSPAAHALWLGVGAGALGAFFSIAVAARSRAILTNIQRRRENRMDAIVRITIGAIGGMLLAGLLQANLISFSIGGVSTGQSSGWMLAAFGAFVAGFSERLIPNLLDRSGSPAGGYTASTEPLDRALPKHNVIPARVHDAELIVTVPQSLHVDWRWSETNVAGEPGTTGPEELADVDAGIDRARDDAECPGTGAGPEREQSQ